MSEEPESIDKKSKKAKADFAEVGFEIGNIEFEAKGKSAVVERLFRLLLEKIEQGKLVATLRLPEEEEDEEEEEEPLEEPTHSDEPPAPPEEDSIPSEAYLDPPPAWDSLEEDSPPISDAEKKSLDDSL